MPVSREVVEHVARLAHLALEPAEVDVMTEELSTVIDHVAVLQQISVSEVEPTSQIALLEPVLREDEIRPSWPVEAVLANAPHRIDDFFEVQAVLD